MHATWWMRAPPWKSRPSGRRPPAPKSIIPGTEHVGADALVCPAEPRSAPPFFWGGAFGKSFWMEPLGGAGLQDCIGSANDQEALAPEVRDLCQGMASQTAEKLRSPHILGRARLLPLSPLLLSFRIGFQPVG